MTELRKAAERALKRLDMYFVEHGNDDDFAALQALRQALAKEEHEPYDQTALELCEKCGWKAIIPDEGCLVCARNEQEPVMWSIFDGKYHDVFDTKYDVDKIIKFKKGKVVVKPLYAAPPQKEEGCAQCGKQSSKGWALYCVECAGKQEWVGLTHEERFLNDCRSPEEIEYAKAIEAKLKEKNS